ncbi:alpha/beta fold hydrolase [Acetobacter sacchari]|uniref:Alpha/beta fold hydrolase n=1 Tax=Acetobacter sacchari TaxID=2661687 RepID=A0ABS3LU38_9PROT|nr:alpha/beta fold hydrolase [Acetobacter sacchari]
MIRVNAVTSNHMHALVSAFRGCGAFHRRLALGGAMLVASLAVACSADPVVHVPARYAEDARRVPPDFNLKLSDGAQIPVRTWGTSTARPRAAILALHGFDDSRDAWEFAAPTLAERGLVLWSPDQRGFGEAPRRGDWVGAARMVRDVREELALLAKAYPGTPIFLMGESMGGAIAILTMTAPDAPHVAGTILLAPAVWTVGGVAALPVRIAAALAPDGRVTGRELPVHVTASDNMAALRRLYFDPLTLRSTKLSALSGLIDLMSSAARAALDLRGPVLLVYGDQDQLVPSAAMAQVWRNLPQNVRRDLIPGGHHLMLRDRRRDRVTADIASWINAPDTPLPSGGDVAAAVWATLNDAAPRSAGR